MSEQYSEEPFEIESPGYFECNECEDTIETTYENTAYFVFEQEPWNNFISTVCENDGTSTAMPIDCEDIDQLEFANQFKKAPFQYISDLNTEKSKRGDKIENKLNEFKGIPPTYELTPGQEERLSHFREILQNAPPGFVVAELVELPMPPKRLRDFWI